jgi:hypothetical protein
MIAHSTHIESPLDRIHSLPIIEPFVGLVTECYALRDGSSEVVLIDESEATWQKYCSLKVNTLKKK